MMTRNSILERLLYVLLVVMFCINIALLLLGAHTLHVLRADDQRKFKVLKSNQDQLICIVRASYDPANYHIDENLKFPVVDSLFINKCIKDNSV